MVPPKVAPLAPERINVFGVIFTNVVPAAELTVPPRVMSPYPPTDAVPLTVKDPVKLPPVALLFHNAPVEFTFIRFGPIPVICTFPNTELFPFKSNPPPHANPNVPDAALTNGCDTVKFVPSMIEVIYEFAGTLPPVINIPTVRFNPDTVSDPPNVTKFDPAAVLLNAVVREVPP